MAHVYAWVQIPAQKVGVVAPGPGPATRTIDRPWNWVVVLVLPTEDNVAILISLYFSTVDAWADCISYWVETLGVQFTRHRGLRRGGSVVSAN